MADYCKFEDSVAVVVVGLVVVTEFGRGPCRVSGCIGSIDRM